MWRYEIAAITEDSSIRHIEVDAETISEAKAKALEKGYKPFTGAIKTRPICHFCNEVFAVTRYIQHIEIKNGKKWVGKVLICPTCNKELMDETYRREDERYEQKVQQQIGC